MIDPWMKMGDPFEYVRGHEVSRGVISYYRVRYTRGGAWCGLKVWHSAPCDPDTGEELDRAPRWQCEFNGKLSDEPERFLLHFNPDETPVIAGEKIDEREYRYLAELHRWAVTHAPNDPAASPQKPINHLQGDLIF